MYLVARQASILAYAMIDFERGDRKHAASISDWKTRSNPTHVTSAHLPQRSTLASRT